MALTLLKMGLAVIHLGVATKSFSDLITDLSRCCMWRNSEYNQELLGYFPLDVNKAAEIVVSSS